MKILLSQGKVTLIDDADYHKVSEMKWCANKVGSTFYAMTNLPMVKGIRGGSLLMHRLLTGAPGGMVVDHMDGDGLNNRRENLRVCTHRQNIEASRSRTGFSQFKGVTFDKARGVWIAQIKVNYARKFLGRYDSQVKAAQAYNAAALIAFGEFAVLNDVTR